MGTLNAHCAQRSVKFPKPSPRLERTCPRLLPAGHKAILMPNRIASTLRTTALSIPAMGLASPHALGLPDGHPGQLRLPTIGWHSLSKARDASQSPNEQFLTRTNSRLVLCPYPTFGGAKMDGQEFRGRFRSGSIGIEPPGYPF